MEFEFLFLGKAKDNFISQGIDEYKKRLSRYATVSLKTIKCKTVQGSDEVIKDKETDLLLANISSPTHPVALDIQGRQYSSTEFAEVISGWERKNIRRVSFVIGGPLGLSERMLGEAREKISLSKMTFTHDMIRLFLIEQVYRAFMIKAGTQYHK